MAVVKMGMGAEARVVVARGVAVTMVAVMATMAVVMAPEMAAVTAVTAMAAEGAAGAWVEKVAADWVVVPAGELAGAVTAEGAEEAVEVARVAEGS